MGKRKIARGQPGDRHAAHGGPASYSYYSTSTAGGQSGWIASKSWADQFWPAVRDLIQHLGFGEPVSTSRDMDWLGCDFTTSRLRWAWRNRSASCLRYRDVTIRVSRPSGAKTEWHKLRHVHFLLFTWTVGNDIKAWMILRADRVRQLLDQRWPTLRMSDAQAVCIPFSALRTAGAIVAAGGAIK